MYYIIFYTIIILSIFYFLNIILIKVNINLVNIKDINKNIIVDLKYFTKDNFMKLKLYNTNKCFLNKEVAYKLSNVQKNLEKINLGLKLYDCYRPKSVQIQMWNKLPDDNYISNPHTNKSNHGKGLAVDVVLVDKNGNELEMPSEFDDFSIKSHRNYKYMTKEGFIYHNNEWWHFHYNNNNKVYSILDFPL